MLSCGYIKKVREMLEMYQEKRYKEVDDGSCNICLGRQQGKVLCFSFESENTENSIITEFAHEKCLENLLDEENFNVFLVGIREKIRKVNRKYREKGKNW